MAKNVKTTLEVQVWKQHTCSHCGSVYRYLFKRKKVGQGPSEDVARAAAHISVMNSLVNEVGMHPCPECGNYQPDMIGSRRRTWHLWLMVTILGIFLVLFILGLSYALSTAATLYLLALLTLPLLLLNLWVALSRPNRNLKANRSRAKKLIASEKMQLAKAGDPDEERDPVADRPDTGLWIVAGCLLAAVLFLPSAAWLRSANAWPLNEKWHPEVVGPGDSAWIWFPHTIRSIKGYWRVIAINGTILNAQELGLAQNQIKVTARDMDWGNSISVKPEEKDNNASIWARLYVPEQSNLAGKKLKVQINLMAAFPAINPAQKNQFLVHTLPATHGTEIDLAAPNAGFLVSALWWIAMVGGFLAFCFAGAYFLLRDKALVGKALPSRVIPLDEVEEQGEPLPKRSKRALQDEDD
jgi:hypothetical protein